MKLQIQYILSSEVIGEVHMDESEAREILKLLKDHFEKPVGNVFLGGGCITANTTPYYDGYKTDRKL